MAIRPLTHRERVLLGPLLERLERAQKDVREVEDSISRVLVAMGLEGAVLDPEWKTLDVRADNG